MNEMVSGGLKAGVNVASPFGRTSMYITLFFLGFLVIFSAIKSYREHSVYPLLDGVVFRTVGADHTLSQSLDSLDPVLVSEHKMFSREWFSYWLAMLRLWWNILVSFWFIFVVLYGLYKLFSFVNIEAPLMNWLYAILFFAVLQLIVGLALYPVSMAGQTLPSDKVVVLNDAFSVSYPFEGVVKLFSRLINGSLFDSVYAFVNSDTGKIVSNIPQGGSL